MNYDQLVFNAGLVRGFDVGNLPEPVNLAFGIEARRESYQIEAGEPRLLRSRPGRGRAGRRAGLSRASSPAMSSTKIAPPTAPTSTSRRN